MYDPDLYEDAPEPKRKWFFFKRIPINWDDVGWDFISKWWNRWRGK